MSTNLRDGGENPDGGALSVSRHFGRCGNCGARGSTYQLTMPMPDASQLPGYGWICLCAPCVEIAAEVVRADGK